MYKGLAGLVGMRVVGQPASLEEEISLRQDLGEKGLIENPKIFSLSLQRVLSGFEGEWQEITATREKTARKISEMTSRLDELNQKLMEDALKELAEAHITYALITGDGLPTPGDLNVEPASYLNGLAEAVGEIRRYVLDRLRRGDVATGERLLAIMDDIYSLLITVDFPNAITGGLRRQTDMVRGVLERTRGDLTTAVRQEEMKSALHAFGTQVGLSTED